MRDWLHQEEAPQSWQPLTVQGCDIPRESARTRQICTFPRATRDCHPGCVEGPHILILEFVPRNTKKISWAGKPLGYPPGGCTAKSSRACRLHCPLKAGECIGVTDMIWSICGGPWTTLCGGLKSEVWSPNNGGAPVDSHPRVPRHHDLDNYKL